MSSRILHAAIFLCSTLFVTSLSARTWTDSNGKTMDASFVRLVGDKVTLRNGNRVTQVPLSTLSQADQDYVAEKTGKKKDNEAKQENPASGSATSGITGNDSANAASPGEERTWTDSKGRKIQARFVEFDAPNQKVKMIKDGKEVSVPINNLSHEDRVYVIREFANARIAARRGGNNEAQQAAAQMLGASGPAPTINANPYGAAGANPYGTPGANPMGLTPQLGQNIPAGNPYAVPTGTSIPTLGLPPMGLPQVGINPADAANANIASAPMPTTGYGLSSVAPTASIGTTPSTGAAQTYSTSPTFIPPMGTTAEAPTALPGDVTGLWDWRSARINVSNANRIRDESDNGSRFHGSGNSGIVESKLSESIDE